MVSDRIYELCRPILENEQLGEEEKSDQLEDLLSSEPASLKGKALEDAVLGALWQWRGAADKNTSPPPARGATVIRSRSPAPWMQRAATPLSSTASGTNSPRPRTATPSHPPGFGPQPPAFARTKSSTASPFTSPRPSPRLPVATPIIPHSPRLSVYQFSESSPTTENYGDFGSDTVDWLVNDDASSTTSYGDAGFATSSDFMSPYTTEMSPYDMLRSILKDHRTDEELEQILEANGYDLSQTINALMEAQGMGADAMAAAVQEQQRQTYLVGKNMSPSSRPATPAGQQKSPIVCRYWLASGHCARADCRFAHEVQNHVCKFWLQGNCIAGPNCLFSHDPAALVQQLNLAGSDANSPQQLPPNFQLQDYDSFPALEPSTSNPYEDTASLVDPNILNAVLAQQQGGAGSGGQVHAPPGLFPTFVPSGPRFSSGGSRSNSRPGSRHASRAPTPSSQPNFQDDEAFPSLGSAAASSKPGKRHHGKRGGHGHHSTTNNNPTTTQQPSNLADVVRMSPAPPPTTSTSSSSLRRGLNATSKAFTSSSTRENSAAALAIPAPSDIPWLETGTAANQAYLAARAQAFKHGGLRNKFLQSAAQAWNRNDARGAKALSLRGQNENGLMREKHREAARALYEERNKHLGGSGGGGGGKKDLYVDLHGLHPEEAVQYLHSCLLEQKGGKKSGGGGGGGSSRPLYAICGTGHHSKNGKDKVGKAVRGFLNEWHYAFREFSVPGDRGNVGGILGIDPASGGGGGGGDKSGSGSGSGDGDSGVDLARSGGSGGDTKVVLVREDPRKVVVGEGGGGGADDEDGEEDG